MNTQLTTPEFHVEYVSSALIRAENKKKAFRKRLSIIIAGAVLSLGASYFAHASFFVSKSADIAKLTHAMADANPEVVAARARIEHARADLRRVMARFRIEQEAFGKRLGTDAGTVLFAGTPAIDARPVFQAFPADFALVRTAQECF